MSNPYEGQNPIDIAKKAEANINSDANVSGHKSWSDTAAESGVDARVEADFPGAKVHTDPEVSGKSTIPEDAGGSIDPQTGNLEKAADFDGVGGPEDKRAVKEQNQGGDDSVRTNIRGPDQDRDYAKNP